MTKVFSNRAHYQENESDRVWHLYRTSEWVDIHGVKLRKYHGICGATATIDFRVKKGGMFDTYQEAEYNKTKHLKQLCKQCVRAVRDFRRRRMTATLRSHTLVQR